MRWRTQLRAGNPGQPGLPVIDPERVPHLELPKHTCGWCGGPRSHSTTTRVDPSRVLCHACMRAEFGSAWDYGKFIRSERARNTRRKRSSVT